MILCLLLAALQAYISPTSQPSHRSVSIRPVLAALPCGASPMPSLPSHLPIPLSLPVQATSAETHPLRQLFSCRRTLSRGDLYAGAADPRPEAIRGRAWVGCSLALREQPRLPATCKDAPGQRLLSNSQNYPGGPREQT